MDREDQTNGGEDDRRSVGSQVARATAGTVIVIIGLFMTIGVGLMWILGNVGAAFSNSAGNYHLPSGVWTPVIAVGVLGIATILAPSLPRRTGEARKVRRRAMSVTRVLATILVGTLVAIMIIAMIF